MVLNTETLEETVFGVGGIPESGGGGVITFTTWKEKRDS